MTKRLPVQEKFGLRDHLRQFASSSDSGEEGAMMGMEHPVVIQMRGGDDMLKQVRGVSNFGKRWCEFCRGVPEVCFDCPLLQNRGDVCHCVRLARLIIWNLDVTRDLSPRLWVVFAGNRGHSENSSEFAGLTCIPFTANFGTSARYEEARSSVCSQPRFMSMDKQSVFSRV